MNNEFRFDSKELEKHREELQLKIKESLGRQAILHVIGISGGAESDKTEQTEEILEDFIYQLRGGGYAVLTGGTEGGIPEMSIKTAKKFSVPTIGVFPHQGQKYALRDSLDLIIETSPPDIGEGFFGTETPTFINMLDASMIMGGGYGTLVEAGTILKTNEKRIRDKARDIKNIKDPIYLAPIVESGGATNHILTIAKDLGKYSKLYMPDSPIYDGTTAAQFILDKLSSKKLIKG